MKARTSLPVNVDFFSAVVYDALGIPPDLCTSIFATGRIAGWCAPALEQYAGNRPPPPPPPPAPPPGAPPPSNSIPPPASSAPAPTTSAPPPDQCPHAEGAMRD